MKVGRQIKNIVLTSVASVVVENLIVYLLVAAVIFGGTREVLASVVVDVDEDVVDFGFCNFLLHNTFCV